ncbi:DUF4357 domain-containing protein [Streptomyces sp. CA-288835]|uniref:DUF4357 domain-containing protein n=1 Tax=Streptomyces sp. CA-288835 TaxID=3240069 RepID=UPI003D8DF761
MASGQRAEEGIYIATLTIHFDPEVLAHIAAVGAEGAVEVNVSLGGGAGTAKATSAPPIGPLAPLMTAGLLRANDVLTFRQTRAKRSAKAIVQPDGQLIVEGKATPFQSPSKAASAVTGSAINGWTLWRLPDGRTLDDLRDKLMSDEG